MDRVGFCCYSGEADPAAKMENIFLETRFSLDNGGHDNCHDDEDDDDTMMI